MLAFISPFAVAQGSIRVDVNLVTNSQAYCAKSVAQVYPEPRRVRILDLRPFVSAIAMPSR